MNLKQQVLIQREDSIKVSNMDKRGPTSGQSPLSIRVAVGMHKICYYKYLGSEKQLRLAAFSSAPLSIEQ